MTLLRSLAIIACLALTACSAPPPGAETASTRSEVTDLARAIRALGPHVDPQEADMAAEIAITYPLALRAQYEVTDPPLIHNTKVNMGLRPRGLCWHWAEDLENRLAAENFQTLDLHRAIANADKLRIDHSTVIVSAQGATMEQGIVLDGWRKGGDLFWSLVPEDRRYEWERRDVVFARR
ncbi:hypothetical protein [Pseudooceanicola atlanticus]|uniref:Lipoprotein n=1 Tax=Pseudooceanicola atlanticus TaxID=1461694 RepID=A0A0A0EG59_9RHOB|nr:hypothetical protein ATO9_14575 [Pseudooceanicola atlanticus]